MGQPRPSKFCPPLDRMSEKQLVLFKTVTERSIEEDAVLMQEKEKIQARIAATITDATTVQDFLRSLCEVRRVLSCLPMSPGQCPDGLTPDTLIVQSAKDLCRESLVINNEVFDAHCTSDLERGAHVLKQKLLLDIFEKGAGSPSGPRRRGGGGGGGGGSSGSGSNGIKPGRQGHSQQQHQEHHDHDALREFHEHKRECVDRVIKAACRTISGGDSYDEIMSLFVSTHFLITPAKSLVAEEVTQNFTEISSHSSCAVVATHSSFDIRFMDDSGSPLEDEYLQVDVTVVEIVDFRTPGQLAGDKYLHPKDPRAGVPQNRRVMCIRMPTVEMYGDIMDLM